MRHIVVDTTGLLLTVVVHPANIQDRDGAKLALMRLVGRFPRLKRIWADGAYAGKLVEWARNMGGWTWNWCGVHPVNTPSRYFHAVGL